MRGPFAEEYHQQQYLQGDVYSLRKDEVSETATLIVATGLDCQAWGGTRNNPDPCLIHMPLSVDIYRHTCTHVCTHTHTPGKGVP